MRLRREASSGGFVGGLRREASSSRLRRRLRWVGRSASGFLRRSVLDRPARVARSFASRRVCSTSSASAPPPSLRRRCRLLAGRRAGVVGMGRLRLRPAMRRRVRLSRRVGDRGGGFVVGASAGGLRPGGFVVGCGGSAARLPASFGARFSTDPLALLAPSLREESARPRAPRRLRLRWPRRWRVEDGRRAGVGGYGEASSSVVVAAAGRAVALGWRSVRVTLQSEGSAASWGPSSRSTSSRIGFPGRAPHGRSGLRGHRPSAVGLRPRLELTGRRRPVAGRRGRRTSRRSPRAYARRQGSRPARWRGSPRWRSARPG